MPSGQRHRLLERDFESLTAVCSQCGPVRMKPNGTDRTGKPTFRCPVAHNKGTRRWQRENPERMKKHSRESSRKYRESLSLEQKESLKRRRKEWFYGMDQGEYDDLFDAQGGKCAICGGHEESVLLSVDHNHETGEVRGLLCRPCNSALGFFKDDPALVESALAYLKEASHS